MINIVSFLLRKLNRKLWVWCSYKYGIDPLRTLTVPSAYTQKVSHILEHVIFSLKCMCYKKQLCIVFALLLINNPKSNSTPYVFWKLLLDCLKDSSDAWHCNYVISTPKSVSTPCVIAKVSFRMFGSKSKFCHI